MEVLSTSSVAASCRVVLLRRTFFDRMTCADSAQGMEKTTMSTGGAEESGLGTLRGRDYPGVRQFSIFSPNRLGQLQNLTKLVESHDLRICALSVADSADCAIIRLVVSEPERCYELLTR